MIGERIQVAQSVSRTTREMCKRLDWMFEVNEPMGDAKTQICHEML